jgi:ABC-type antimicrobial peptide transport system permease subunit
MEIIGIVGDAREDALNSTPTPYVYICIMPGGWPDPEYVVRTAGDPTRVLADVRAAVHEVDPNRAVFGLDTLANVIDATLDQPRLDAQLVGFFAIAALLLTSVGIYSLVTLIVISRTREIGVRMALGASPGRIVRETAGAIARVLLAGMCVGLLAAAIVGRAMRSLLFGVTPLDPAVVILTLSAMAAASMIATLLPAFRAARIDPVVAVRGE